MVYLAPTEPPAPRAWQADVAQLVERNLAKVEVAGSSPVVRSARKGPSTHVGGPFRTSGAYAAGRFSAPARSAVRRLSAMAASSKAPAVEIEVGDHTVRLSSPDRVYFSERGETKRDLVDYYLSVGPGIVNALRERPCMLHRFPKGVDGPKVHQKRLPAGAPPWVETVRLHFPRYGLHADELCVTRLADVIWAVQMSTVEFHPWNSRRADTESPDEWRIDLDPMPECGFEKVRRAAATTHEILDELGAVGWPKTSGGSGLHVYVRIAPRLGVQGRAPRRAGVRPRGRAAAARRRDDDVVAQGPVAEGPLRRLQPERA